MESSNKSGTPKNTLNGFSSGAPIPEGGEDSICKHPGLKWQEPGSLTGSIDSHAA
ncbi:MAG: hypothetical protein K2X66_08280 [Cyanobacteria bacterium]|nr:hypothetical protein [Cyanobacteriota bacterium]